MRAPAPDRVELSVSGILNDQPFHAYGALSVDNAKGIKQGTITYDPPPKGVVAGPDSTFYITSRCFVGATWVGERPSVGPLGLLGQEFSSLRVATEGRYGTLSLGETARLESGTLRSEIVGVGKLRRPPVRSVGPLREVITVGGDGTLLARGSYSLVTRSGRRIPVRYHHFYESSRPDLRLFGRYRNWAYLLRVTFKVKATGKKVRFESHSTIRRIKPR